MGQQHRTTNNEPEIRYQHAQPNEQRKTVTENDKEQQHDGDEIQHHI